MEKTRSVYARLHTPQQGTALFLLCWAAYAAAYVGRYNYSAVMGAMTAEGVLTLQAAGAVSTGYFLCYAAGQVLSGFACQWVSPYRMIFAGLALSGLCNLGMAALPPALMPVLWAANGLFQAMVWPPIVRLFAECMPLAQQKGACININSTTPAGTLASYALCAVLLALTGWRTAFTASALVLLVMAGVWVVATAPLRRAAPAQVLEASPAPDPEHTASAQPKNGGQGVLLGAGLLGLAVPVILHGALKDGVTSWVPTMVQANFAVSPALSAAVSMVLPLVNLTGAYLAGWLDRRWLHNELKTCAVLFGAATIALALLPLAVGRSLPLALALLAVTTAAMLGINTLFINVIPVRAGRSGGAAALSGLLNAVTYVGAAAATWGVGVAADSWGWSAVFILWLVMAVVSLVTVLLCAGRWARFTAEQEEV